MTEDKIPDRFYEWASGFYLSDLLPKDWSEMEEGEANAFIEANAWQPFENHDGEVIAQYIQQLAESAYKLVKREITNEHE